jgi:hypothetical protein
MAINKSPDVIGWKGLMIKSLLKIKTGNINLRSGMVPLWQIRRGAE